MNYPLLQNYLAQLQHDFRHSQLSADSQGRVVGRFYHASLSSVYQPIRHASDLSIHAYEASTRGHSGAQGLLVERLLEQSASDEESIELDRLSRLIHTLNFFRQNPSQTTRLILNVHNRLLAAVESGHGRAFLRILQVLGVPQQQVVLQLPAISASQTWVLQHVADNYQRNGFQVALQAHNLAQAHEFLSKLRPAWLVLPAHALTTPDLAGLSALLAHSQQQQSQVLINAINDQASWDKLRVLAEQSQALHLQGNLWDKISSDLVPEHSLQADGQLQAVA